MKKECFICSFDFCGVTDERSPVENLGQVLFGERIRPSPYKVCVDIQLSVIVQHCSSSSTFSKVMIAI